MVSRIIAGMWRDLCDVIVRVEKRDPVTKITSFEEAVLFHAQPCKLSYKSLTSTTGDNIAAVTQSVKLFLSPELIIPAGSKIVVKRPGGAVTEYAQSGQPGVFTNHQELILELWKRWA